jgi:hypothetical protein
MIADIVAQGQEAKNNLESAESLLAEAIEKVADAMVKLQQIRGEMDANCLAFALAHAHEAHVKAFNARAASGRSRENIDILLRVLRL